MDLITLAMAKKYTDAQRLGYSAYERASNVSYIADGSGQEVIPGEALGVSGSYVYASPEVFTGGVVLSAKGMKGGVDVFEISNLRIEVSNDGIWMLFGDLMGDRLLALSFGNATAQVIGVSAGTYVWKEEISGVDYWLGNFFGYFTETIHPIDPKFIPGAVLPVVEVKSDIGQSLFLGDYYPLTEEESAAFEKVNASGLPCIVRFTLSEQTLTAVSIHGDDGGVGSFIATVATMSIAFTKIDDSGGWGAMVQNYVG